ncbi:HD domain-containing protein [bacterium]|nr:HD domain-containing protein [bacterium]
MTRLDELYLKMVDYYADDPARIQHFVKVHSFAALIGRQEGLDPQTQQTLEAAALVHDIGIRPAEAQYHSADGRYQEQLGPAPAREMVLSCGFAPAVADRVAWLVGHHHTYTAIDGPDYQILVEADFLVNLHEDGVPRSAARHALEHIFRTPTGTALCKTMFGL